MSRTAQQDDKAFRFLLIFLLSLAPLTVCAYDDWDDEISEKEVAIPLSLVNNNLKNISEGSIQPVAIQNNCHLISSDQKIEPLINVTLKQVTLENKTIKKVCPKNKFEPSYYYVLQASDYPYFPPFRKNQRFIISQSYKGNPKLNWLEKNKPPNSQLAYNKITTHTGKSTNYAVDLTMPVGTSICASREGLVLDVKQNQKAGLWNKIVQKSNYVKIKHDDGSLALYAHLKHNSITKNIGDFVKKGECFALSGNTGKSSGPHLHFAVLVPTDNNEISIPFEFSNADGKLITPMYMEWLFW